MNGKPIDPHFGPRRTRLVNPKKTIGVPGTAIYGGYIESNETNPALSSQEMRYRTYSDMLANVSIVSAGTRYFLNLLSKAVWSFVPSESDTDGKYSDLLEGILISDPDTPWHRVVRRCSMYRFYGFSIQEWTAKKRDDGVITFADISPRPQSTIDKWDISTAGEVLGVVQRSPQDSRTMYLPRSKLLYLIDDTINDSPEGLGLFRHLVEPSQRLNRYEQLEGFGFETDLRGIPIGRGPFSDLHRMVKNGELTQAQRIELEAPLRQFVGNHIRSDKLGMLIDSITYESQDGLNKPSNQKQWDIDILKGSPTSLAENAQAIERINHEMARILGVDQLFLGSSKTGSYALSLDKTNTFFLLIDSALQEIAESVNRDLVVPIWGLNGFPKEMMPRAKTEPMRHTNIEQITLALRDLASAGAVLDPSDPSIDEIRDLVGLSRRPKELIAAQSLQAKKEEASIPDPNSKKRQPNRDPKLS